MLSEEEVERIEASIIEVINTRATELRQLMITIGSIIALLMPAVEMFGVIDLTPYGEGDDEWIGDSDWEWGDDFECGDGSIIQSSLVNDGYRNCRDGSDEPEEEVEEVDGNNTVILPKQGCTDPDANNYDVEAEEEDGSCTYYGDEPIQGCTDENATNYESWAEADDGSCEYEDDNEIPEDCRPDMWDAYYDYDGENMTITWDADLTCNNAPHNLTLIWTFYYNNTTTNETGEWTGIQEMMTYETYYQDWDYVNITIAVPAGYYDIFGTFGFNDTYYIAVDWFGVRVE